MATRHERRPRPGRQQSTDCKRRLIREGLDEEVVGEMIGKGNLSTQSLLEERVAREKIAVQEEVSVVGRLPSSRQRSPVVKIGGCRGGQRHRQLNSGKDKEHKESVDGSRGRGRGPARNGTTGRRTKAPRDYSSPVFLPFSLLLSFPLFLRRRPVSCSSSSRARRFCLRYCASSRF
jgi:hypothetical protein